jgi:hypothetical protein
MKANPTRCQSIIEDAITATQNDRQLWHEKGLISGRLKLIRALANPIGNNIIIR